jgi:prohibitin 2
MAFPPHSQRPPRSGGATFGSPINPAYVPRLLGLGVLLFVLVLAGSTATYIVQPGTRGIKITLGKAADDFLPAGFGFKTPFVTSIVPVNVRQKTQPLKAACFSSDLQQVTAELRILYRVPEQSVVQIYKQFAGDPFDSLIAPRVQEAIKEVTALQTAEQIVTNRQEIKEKTLTAARQKIGDILWVEDIVIRSLDLSPELERAIEAKMVAEQQAAQARFTQLQKQVEAETAIIRAGGEAEAIKVRGEALRLNPAFLRLEIVEQWNGKSPLVVPSIVNSSGAGLLLPLGTPEPPSTP